MPTPRKYSSDAARQKAFRERRKLAVVQELARKGIPGPPALSTVPGRVRWMSLLAQAQAALQLLHDEMEGYIGDRSETWQESDRAAQLQDRLDQVSDVLSSLEEIEL